MSRDEILAEIAQLSTVPPEGAGLDEVQARMAAIVSHADAYLDGEADRQYLAEALREALLRFSDALQPYA